MPLIANPSRPRLIAVAFLGVPFAVLGVLGAVFWVAAIATGRLNVGLLIALIALSGFGLLCALVSLSALRDLRRQQPVLTIGDETITDSRIVDTPIAWSDVLAATSLRSGYGGVVLELRVPLVTRLDPWRPGSLLFQKPAPGIAHIPLRHMTVPTRTLARAILDRAAHHGADVAVARSHPKMIQPIPL